MKSRAIRALLRASWLSARSYRASMAFSLLSLPLTIVPLYFIARALQPIVQGAIAFEGGEYFAFVATGTAIFGLTSQAVGILPNSLGGGITSGFVESLLLTPASRLSLLLGLSSYGMLWAAIKALLLMVAAWVLGAHIGWAGMIAALPILLLLVLVHWGIGVIGAAAVIAFRTMGPLAWVVMLSTALFGGIYWPTSSIPPYLKILSAVTPMAYGLRALRAVVLNNSSLLVVRTDVLVLSAMTAATLLIATVSFRWALDYARRNGSLNLY